VQSEPVQLRPDRPAEDVLREYSEVLVRKLEEKALQLQQANASLHETAALLKKAQRLANVGSWSWHVQLGKVEWSEQMFRIFGLDPATFAGDLGDVVNRAVHPDDHQAVFAVDEAVRRGEPPRPLEYRVVWPDGTQRVVWTEAGELTYDREGRPELLTGIAQDITRQRLAEADLHRSMSELSLSRRALLSLVEDQKRAEAEVRRLNAELEQRVRDRTAQLEAANQELDAFAYSVSHDLRAPLRAIDGFAQILVEDYGPKLDDEGRRLCGVVSDSARDMGRLIDALLALSRIGRAGLRPTAPAWTSAWPTCRTPLPIRP
jgi:hypothetical protein